MAFDDPLVYTIKDKTSMATKGTLSVIGPDPTFVGVLNQGVAALQLRLPGPPSDQGLDEFDYVDVQCPLPPSGTLAGIGIWRYYNADHDEQAGDQWIVDLFPISAQLSECTFDGNYTDLGTPSRPALHPQHFDVGAFAAILQTKDCRGIGDITNDGNMCAVDYIGPPRGSTKVRDVLQKCADMGGPDWWWYCSGYGVVDVTNRAPHTWVVEEGGLDNPKDVLWHHMSRQVSSVFNVMPVTGGTTVDAVGFVSSVSSLGVLPSTHVYAPSKIGFRTAPTWVDTAIRDQATLDRLATNVLARAAIRLLTITLHLRRGYNLVRPGDKVIWVDWSGFHYDPYYVEEWRLFGSTGIQEVVLKSAIGAYHSNPNQAGEAIAYQSAQTFDTGNAVVAPLIWSGSGVVLGSFSTSLVLERETTFFAVVATLGTAATVDLVIQFYRTAGPLIGAFVIPTGAHEYQFVVPFSAPLNAGASVNVLCANPDGTAADITIQASY